MKTPSLFNTLISKRIMLKYQTATNIFANFFLFSWEQCSNEHLTNHYLYISFFNFAVGFTGKADHKTKLEKRFYTRYCDDN